MTDRASDRFSERSPSGVGARVLLAGESAAVATGHLNLKEAGYDARLERDGRTALAALDQASFDLVIVNWQLPDRDGVGLCRTIRARPRHEDLHIIVLTPVGGHGPVQALEAGADDYLITPFEKVQLLA